MIVPLASFLSSKAVLSSVMLLNTSVMEVGDKINLVLPSEHERGRRAHPDRAKEH